jgi:dihydropteroate synthase
MHKITKNPSIKSLNCRGKLIQIDKALIMGILNISDDSFFDAGKFNNINSALKKTEDMLKEGADIIDIGAVSTKPGAKDVDINNELQKLIPILTEIKKQFSEAVISVDTWRAKVAKESLDIGADIINDISGGQFDDKMMEVVGKYDAPYILMHTKEKPSVMQKNPSYSDVVTEVKTYFSKQIAEAKESGINDILLDPGFGFGKTVEHNYKILHALNEFNIFNKLVLVGISRKSMINNVLDIEAKQALNGTTVLNTIALLNGADILRVHDVKEAKEVILLVERLINSTKPT